VELTVLDGVAAISSPPRTMLLLPLLLVTMPMSLPGKERVYWSTGNAQPRLLYGLMAKVLI